MNQKRTALGIFFSRSKVNDETSGEILYQIPNFGSYCKALLAIIYLPFVGTIWVFVKGMYRLVGSSITYRIDDIRQLVTRDRRYRSGYRVEGTKRVRIKTKRLKVDSPYEHIRRFEMHAVIYILLALCSIPELIMIYKVNTIPKETKTALTSWNNFEATQGEIIVTGEIIFPTCNSKFSDDVFITMVGNNYVLNAEYDVISPDEYIIKSDKGEEVINKKMVESSSAPFGIKVLDQTFDFYERMVIPKKYIEEFSQITIIGKKKSYLFSFKENLTNEQ